MECLQSSCSKPDSDPLGGTHIFHHESQACTKSKDQLPCQTVPFCMLIQACCDESWISCYKAKQFSVEESALSMTKGCAWSEENSQERSIFFLPTFVAMNSSTRARLPAQFYCNLLGFVANLTQSFLTTCLNFNFFLLNTSFPFPQTKFKVQMQFWHRGGDAACIHMKQEPGMVAKFKSENVFAQCEQSHSIFRVAEWHYSSSWTFV